MTSHPRNLVSYRLEKARETLEDARILAAAGRWNACNDLFERRKESDYVNFVHFEEGQVLPWVSRVEEFVDYIAS